MGDGADMDGGQPQPSGWGPEEPVYQHSGFQPQYAPQPVQVYAPPPQQYAAPQYPTPQAPRPQMRRSRRSSKVEQRLRMVQCFEELLSQPIFNDPGDPYASAVQDEISAFAQRRIDELFGEPGKSDASAPGFTPDEAAALKVLAQRMMAPDEEGAETDAAPAAPVAPAAPPKPPPPPPAPARGPRGCPNPGCQFPPHDRNYPCSNAPPAPPPQRPQPPPQAEREAAPPPSAPQVIARPSPAQRAALEAARARPQPPPQQVPQQPRQPAPPPAPIRGRRGKRAETQPLQPAGPPAKPFPPPPKRFPMPQGAMMTVVTGQKAEEAIASGGTVLSETFVRSNKL